MRFGFYNGPPVYLPAGGTFTSSVTFSAASYFADGTEALPGIAFAGAPGTGIRRSGTTLGLSIAGSGVASINQFGTFLCTALGPSGGSFYVYAGASNVATITDVNDTNSAGLRCAYEVSSPGASPSPSVALSRRLHTNAGAVAEFIVTLPASAPVGYETTVADVGGTGGIAFIAPNGESIRVGLSVTSGAARKVASASGAGAVLTVVKMTSTLWMAKDGFVGTFVGS